MKKSAENIVSITPTATFSNSANMSGRIINIQDGLIQIQYANQLISAEKAFSCLVEPRINDTVLFSQDQFEQAYVIAILAREEESSMTLKFAPSTTLASEKSLTLNSVQITQVSQKSLQKTGEATIDFQQGLIKGDKLHSHIRHIHSISDLISTMAKQAIQKFNTYVRKSDSSDQVQAAQMGRKVDGLYTMNSKHTVMVSQKDTKIDGEHIHMG